MLYDYNEVDEERRFRIAGYGDRYDHQRARERARPDVQDRPAEPQPKDLPAERVEIE